MEPTATFGANSAGMESARTEISDFDGLVRVYWPRVFRFALASLRDRDAAETLTQDCFMRAFRARDRFRGEASVATWLMRIAVNLARDAARNRKLQFWKRASASAVEMEDAGNLLPASGASPEAGALLKEKVQIVWNAASRLSERQRSVFLLRFVEDMDILEIAAATGMKEGTVKAHLFRAVEAVRAELGRRQ
jgi:RNA polymerase sigma-70 factor, ECF subfamily